MSDTDCKRRRGTLQTPPPETQVQSETLEQIAMTDLFRIKPLEWGPIRLFGSEGEEAKALSDSLHYRVTRSVYKHRVIEREIVRGDWKMYLVGHRLREEVQSLEEGKQLAEQHWQEYIKQALVPMETER